VQPQEFLLEFHEFLEFPGVQTVEFQELLEFITRYCRPSGTATLTAVVLQLHCCAQQLYCSYCIVQQ
jgi:hypothetical protein